MSLKAPRSESIFIAVNAIECLHLKRFLPVAPAKSSPAILLLHGQMENGRIFYSTSGIHGLGPFLANQGMDVFIPDLRGHGKSTPATGPQSTYGQSEWLLEDLPAIVAKIKQIHGRAPDFWLGHSWGGVVLFSFFARNPDLQPSVKAMVLVSSRRRITKISLAKWFYIDFLWHIFGNHLVKKNGYLPLSRFNKDRDNASQKEYRQTCQWLRAKAPWLDPEDEFDYAQALRGRVLPKLLFMTGEGDPLLGNSKDVRLFMREATGKDIDLKIVGQSHGFKKNYDHINILTDREAPQDHFNLIRDFLEEKGNG